MNVYMNDIYRYLKALKTPYVGFRHQQSKQPNFILFFYKGKGLIKTFDAKLSLEIKSSKEKEYPS